MNKPDGKPMAPRRRYLASAGIAAAFVLLLVAPAAQAQRSSYQQMMDFNRMIMNRTNNAMITRNICEDWKRKGETVPAECAEYVSPSTATKTTASPAPKAPPSPAALAALRFKPATGNQAMRAYANDVGSNAEEREQLLQVFTATKAAFEQDYGPKGWKNNVAGAFAFFIGSIGYIWSGHEPDAATQDRLFQGLTALLAEAPEIAKASAQEKAALYDTLIASASMPLVLYIDGSQKNDKAQMEQARKLAAEYSRKVLNTEPQTLAAML